jgi:hemoglobin
MGNGGNMFERLCIGIVVLAACGASSKPAQPPPDNRPLFERLGGQPAINAVVHEFVLTTKADARISQFFTNTDPVKLEQAMDDHVCSITGGGCTYRGKSMRDAHTNMKLGDADFAAFMDDLRQVLVKLNVPEREGREVLSAFAGMKGDVVGH